MKTIAIAHVFYDINMSFSHPGLRALLQKKLKKSDPDEGEIFLFINKAHTACKLLAPGNSFIYHRTEESTLSIEDIKSLPVRFGGHPLRFTKELATALLNKFEKKAA